MFRIFHTYIVTARIGALVYLETQFKRELIYIQKVASLYTINSTAKQKSTNYVPTSQKGTTTTTCYRVLQGAGTSPSSRPCPSETAGSSPAKDP